MPKVKVPVNKQLNKSDNVIKTIEYPSTVNEGKKYKYTFWSNKPVKQFNENIINSNIIEDLTQRKVYASDEPITLPSSLEWINVNLKDELMMNKVVEFLQLYYLPDEQDKFIPVYSTSFIKWMLGITGFLIAIVSKSNSTICGVVGGMVKTMTVFDKTEKFGSVKFLCALPLYRKKKIAYTLIDESVRRLVKLGVKQGYFVTERCVPSPVTTIRYYDRPINYIKLQKIKYIDIGGEPEKVQTKFDLKTSVSHNYVEMTKEHIEMVYVLYNKYIVKYNVYIQYTQTELETLLLNECVNSYVVLDNNNVVDFISYYKLTYNVIGSDEKINTGVLFLYTCINKACDEMVENILKFAKINELDLFTVNDTMMIRDVLFTKDYTIEEESDIESYDRVFEHKFIRSTKTLHLNYFNWKCPTMKSNQVSIII